jgi:hypothetical protein
VSRPTFAEVMSWYRGAANFSELIHPQLEAVEEPAGDNDVLRRSLDVQNSRARCHPLGVAVGDHPSAAVGVLVLHEPVDHVRDGLEAAVGMPGRALGFAGRVLDFAHLVHVNDRVEGGQVDARKRTTHREPLTLKP